MKIKEPTSGYRRRKRGYWAELADKMEPKDSVYFDEWAAGHAFVITVRKYYQHKKLIGEYTGQIPMFKTLKEKNGMRVWRVF